MNDFVTLKELAEELGLDRSNLRKYAKKLEIEFVRVRTPESRNQLTLAVTVRGAEYIRHCRKSAGFSKNTPVKESLPNFGVFYAVVPDISARPNRLKFGFTTDLQNRISAHRTCCPEAQLISQWQCKRTWDRAIIDSISSTGGITKISGEVYDCDDVELVINHLNQLFFLMEGRWKESDYRPNSEVQK